jgi:general secretion pathway protein G
MKTTIGAPGLRRAGFTLIELLVVIAIILVLAGLTIGAMALVQRIRDESKAQVQISLLSTGLDSYKAEMGAYPPGNGDADSTVSLREDLYPPATPENQRVYLSDLGPSNGQGWGVAGAILDPYRNPYRYRSPGVNNPDFDLWSLGHDGVEGTGDDINNW